jgi:hypothetical protein
MSCLISGCCRLNRSLIILSKDVDIHFVDIHFVTRTLYHASQQRPAAAVTAYKHRTSFKQPQHSIRDRKELIQGRERLQRMKEGSKSEWGVGASIDNKMNLADFVDQEIDKWGNTTPNIIRSVLRDTNRRSLSPQPLNTNSVRLKPPSRQEHFHERAPKSPTSRSR